ncbi:MAG: hypothetical protein OXT49_00090 [Gammaproteobacteria bacterium]|nr:hypothetical protein [Gammaproteobacteria bacterium]
MGGFFELTSARDLHKKCLHEFEEFHNHPSHYNLFNLVTSVAHLREWIWPKGHKRYGEALESEATAARLHNELHKNGSYKIILNLCNSAKHYGVSSEDYRQEVTEGAQCGVARCGDRLGQDYFLVNGQDVRFHLNEVMSIYNAYFRED